MQSRQEALIHLSQWAVCAALSLTGSHLSPSWPGFSHITGLEQEHSVILTPELAEPQTGRGQISVAGNWDSKLIIVPVPLRLASPGPKSPCQTLNSQGSLYSRGGQELILETRFYWDVATPLCVCAMQGFFPASSCNRHHMALNGNIYYLSLLQVWSPALVLGIANVARAPIPHRAPPGSLPKATQTSLRQAPSAARVWAGVAAGRAGTTV